jgi:Fe-S-cluster containining protein
MCCITAWNLPSNTNNFILDWIWVDSTLRFCPFLSAEGMKPSCLIYPFRPRTCREFVCDKPRMIAYLKKMVNNEPSNSS